VLERFTRSVKDRRIAESRFAARALSAIFAEEAVEEDAAELGVQSECGRFCWLP